MKSDVEKLKKVLTRTFYEHNRMTFILALISTILNSILFFGISLIIREMADTISGVEHSKSLGEIAVFILLFLGLVFGSYIMDYVSKPRFIFTAVKNYKNCVLHKLMEKNILSFGNENTSVYISALSNDLEVIETGYLEGQFQIISNVISFVGAFALMLFYSPLLTGIVVLLTIVPMVASVFTGNKLEPIERHVSEENIKFSSILKDVLNGFSVVKSFQAEREILRLLKGKNQELEQSKLARRKVKILVGMIGMTASLFAQFGVFFAGVWMVVKEYAMTAGTVILFVNLMNFIVSPIGEIWQLVASRRAAKGLIQKMAEALAEHHDLGGKLELEELKSAISLEHVSFRYEENTEVLHDITLRLEKGKSYAIVGSSGCGKSTLLNLLLGGMEDYRGSIFFDAYNIKEISKDSLYHLVSMIQQNVFVFDATIRENITMYKEFSDSKIQDVLQLAKLEALIKEKGQLYKCGENGCGLSGGEKQRISIARSLLKHASVLLVDEATASLDRESAYEIVSDILEIRDVTRVVVTHSLEEALLKRYDQIITMKDGRIVEQGKFEELMEKREYFYALYTVAK